jgi:AGCS family alanine or glycine:cation symporter
MDAILGKISGVLWGPILIPLLLLVGFYLMIALKFLTFRKLVSSFRLMWSGRHANPDHKGELTPFRALMTSLSATIGTGNIVGVATAIVMGGPGALFWMWITALVGMSTKFCEATLAVHYREKTPAGSYVGGPMFYIKNGLGKNWKWLAFLFAVFGAIASFGIGNMTQANSITQNVAGVLSPWFNARTVEYIVAILLFIFVGLVTVGGVKRVGAVAGTFVPAMSLIYFIAGIIVLVIQYDKIPGAFETVFKSAFGLQPVAGATVGTVLMYAMRFGVARGLFSNEAGLGSAPIAHATAIVKHPVKQGLIAMLGPFIDTIIVCSISGLVIMVSGLVTVDPASTTTGFASASHAGVLTQDAFNAILPGMKWIVTLSLILFAFSTILGWCVYGERCIIYLFGDKGALPFRIFFTIIVPIGALLKLQIVWDLSDVFNALMAIPNLIALVLLSPVVFKLVKDFFSDPKNLE